MTTTALQRAPLRYEVFGSTTVLTYPGWVECHLPGGYVLSALPEPTVWYEHTAHDHGFPDGEAMNREHDRTHAQLAAWLGLPASPALMAAATHKDGGEVAEAEEAVVMALHRYTNALKRNGLLPP